MTKIFGINWSSMLRILSIISGDIKSAVKKFIAKNGVRCLICVVLLFAFICYTLGTFDVHVTSIVGNTVLFVLMLLVASLIGFFEVNCEDGFIATGDWSMYGIEIMLLSPFVAISNMYALWGIAVIVIIIGFIIYFIFTTLRRAHHYCASVKKRL